MAKMRRRFILRGLIGGVALCCLCLSGTRAYAAEDNRIFDGATVKVHTAMSEGSDIAASLIAGSRYEVLDTQTDDGGSVWYRVRTNFGAEGYVKAGELEKLSAADSSSDRMGELTALQTINLRREPSTDSEILDKIEEGEQIPYFEEYVNEAGELWYQVSYGNSTGYVADGAVTVAAEMQDRETGEDGEEDRNNDGEPYADDEENGAEGEQAEAPEEAGEQNPDSEPEGAGEQNPGNEPEEAEVQNSGSESEGAGEPEENGQPSREGKQTDTYRDTDFQTKADNTAKGRIFRLKPDLLTVACLLGDICCLVMLTVFLKLAFRTVRTGKKGKRQERRSNAYKR